MWISAAHYRTLDGFITSSQNQRTETMVRAIALESENTRILIENQRLVSTLEWFKHRLTQVEQERAQLIYAATGGKGVIPAEVKIPYPNFVGTPTLSESLNEMNNPFGTLGEDSLDPADQIPAHGYENMPGRER